MQGAGDVGERDRESGGDKRRRRMERPPKERRKIKMKDERGRKRNVRKEVKFMERTETSKMKYSITFKYSLIKMRSNIFRNLEVKKTESPS